MLRINNLKVSYGTNVALQVNNPIEISNNDRVGIIGNNGAGKSTFVKALTGLVHYTGSIESAVGKDEMAVHLQENGYVRRMPVKMIMEAVFNQSIINNPDFMEVIKFFDFEGCLKKRYAQLSGGQKQKFTVIMILLQDKPLTFFDEVTSGLDFESRQKLIQKLSEWYSGKEKTLLFVSHYYDELEKMINKLLIIDQGKIVDFGEVDTLFKKYCGGVIFILDKTNENEEIFRNYKQIGAPAHLIALTAQSPKDEELITRKLIENDINFKRSNNDIEILFVNAIKGGKK